MDKTDFTPKPQSPVPTPKFQTLGEAFAEYSRQAIPDLLSARVVRAIQAGFYAGAQSTLVLLQEKVRATDDSDFSDEEYAKATEAIFNSIHNEAVEYFQAVYRDLSERYGNGSR